MPLVVPGVQGIYNSGNLDARNTVPDFGTLIQRIMPNGTAPLFALTNQFKKAVATDTEHGYWTKTLVFPEFSITANVGPTDTVIKVDATDFLIPGQVFISEATGEQVIINAIIGLDVHVTRGPTPTTIPTSGPKAFYNIGNAHEEGSIRPTPQAINPVRISNLTQIFRNTYAITGTAEAVKVIAGDTTAAENMRDGAQFHAQALETAIIFGKKTSGYRNNMPFRTMDGIISIVSNPDYYPASHGAPNVHTALSSGTDEIMLENMLDPVFNQRTEMNESNRRLMFVGSTALRTINDIAKLNGEYQLVDGQTNFGLRFKTLTMARGTFELIEHPLFNTNGYWKKMALVVDPSSFSLAYLGGRDTQDRKFNQKGDTVAQDNGIDATGGTLTTECTAQVSNPPANAVIWNLTKGLKNA